MKTSEEVDVFYCDLPIMVILERKYGVRKFTREDLDRICREQYGETHARYDAERDYCVVTFERPKPRPMEVDLIRVGGY